jgi:hypothetical protein
MTLRNAMKRVTRARVRAGDDRDPGGQSGNRTGNYDLFVMRADGSGLRNISRTPAAREFGFASWSPDDRWIAFNSDADGDDEIYVVRPDGTGRRQLTRNATRDFHPSFSPVGKSIAFIVNRKGALDEWDNPIFVMDADGSNERQLGDISPIHGSLSWSQPGDAIAFNAIGRELFVEIFTIDTGGTTLRRLTFSPPQTLQSSCNLKASSPHAGCSIATKEEHRFESAFAPVTLSRLGRSMKPSPRLRSMSRHIRTPVLVDRFGRGTPFAHRAIAIATLQHALTMNLPRGQQRTRAVGLLAEMGVRAQ